MSHKRYTPEQIIGMLREAEEALARAETVVGVGSWLCKNASRSTSDARLIRGTSRRRMKDS